MQHSIVNGGSSNVGKGDKVRKREEAGQKPPLP
jgi:hypothetical protein